MVDVTLTYIIFMYAKHLWEFLIWYQWRGFKLVWLEIPPPFLKLNLSCIEGGLVWKYLNVLGLNEIKIFANLSPLNRFKFLNEPPRHQPRFRGRDSILINNTKDFKKYYPIQ